MADSTPTGPSPERGRLSALWRLLPFARPYRGLIALTFGAALVATLAQLTVPLVTEGIVDGPLARGDRAGLVPLLALALVFGIAEAFLFFLRRWSMGKSSLQLERDLRQSLYQRLPRLPGAVPDPGAAGRLRRAPPPAAPAAAGGLPRPRGVGPGGFPRHPGHVHDPPVRRLRGGLPR